MKKFFTLMLALVAVVAVNATKAVFDFTNPAGLGITPPAASAGTNISGQSFVVDGVTMSNVKVASTENRVWNANGVYDLRIYTNSTITFTAEENITAVEFDGKNIKFSEATGKVWTGEATSVTFTATGTCNINKITVTVGEPADVWTPDVVTVSQAITLAKNSDAHDHYVTGVVKCQPFITYATFKDKVSFWMYDAENPSDTIEFYDGLGKDGAKWASLEAAWEELRIGDTIKVYAGALAMYTPKESDISFAEITGGNYVEKLGANPNPPEIVYPVLDTITVAEALNLAKALTPESGKSAYTDKQYVVGGYIIKIKDAAAKTYYMSDDKDDTYGEFQAYKCETIDSEVAIGDYVYVSGTIQNYNGGTYNNYEIAYGALVHGEAPADPVLEPITVPAAVEAALALGNNETSTEKYAVLGFVAKVYEDWSAEHENISFWMTDEEGSTYGKLQCRRTKMAVEQGPVLVAGDKVLIVGKLTNNFYNDNNTPQIYQGNAEIEGFTAIENIILTEKVNKVIIDGVLYIVRDGKMYDVRGAQVR